jgi:hypothetical protein
MSGTRMVSRGKSKDSKPSVAEAEDTVINIALREAEKVLPEEMRNFMKDIQQRTGAQLFVLAAFERPNGNVGVTRYVL